MLLESGILMVLTLKWKIRDNFYLELSSQIESQNRLKGLHQVIVNYLVQCSRKNGLIYKINPFIMDGK